MIHQILSQRVPQQFESLSYKNIVVAGGNTKIPGFVDRLRFEIDEQGRLSDMVSKSSISSAETQEEPGKNYSTAAIKGLQAFEKSDRFASYCVQRHEYMEDGPQRIIKRFYL